MSDYDLYYWPVPFRGQFIRAILAFAGKRWTEHDGAAIGRLTAKPPTDQPAPFMGPPVLVDHAAGMALSQMPAIALYLGEMLRLIPDSTEARARTVKIVGDANDVLDDITHDGGREMWTAESWLEYQPRLERWMAIFEASAGGITSGAGWLLGTQEPTVADIVTGTLWSVMGERFPSIGALFDREAPRTAGLSRRIAVLPPLAALAEEARSRYGNAWCGGEIEASLRKVTGD